MPSFDVDSETINVFEVDGTYLFKQYFDRDEVFSELQEYYNSTSYRFEIPEDELDSVRETLEEYFYELEVVDDVEEFCVVKEKYTEHADILRNSVWQTSRGDYNVFLVKDQLSVEQAIEQGATKLEDTDLEVGL